MTITPITRADCYTRDEAAAILGIKADTACLSANAANILAAYFHEHGIQPKADAEDWQGVRRAVNGGLNGWETFIASVNALQGLR